MTKSVPILVVLALLCITAPSAATTVLQQSFPDLVQKADTIVVGTVSAIAAEWDAATETPFTLVTFTDLDILKGDPGQTALTLRFLGGPRPDGTTLQIAGVPQFSVGGRNVLFVAGNAHYAIPLVGAWQGVYRVVFDPARDTDVLYTPAMQPLTALPTGGGDVLHDEAPTDLPAHPLRQAAPEALSLESLTQAIEQEVTRD